MKIKWQWFLGGYDMLFWIAIILFIIFIFVFVFTYIIDPTTLLYMTIKDEINQINIKDISNNYLKSLGIKINKPIYYRYVKYKPINKTHIESDTITVGTFHEWNNKYYIDISVDIPMLQEELIETVRHETRHMIVRELKNKKIIDLSKYTEEIAQEKNEIYSNLFNCGVKLLKEEQLDE